MQRSKVLFLSINWVNSLRKQQFSGFWKSWKIPGWDFWKSRIGILKKSRDSTRTCPSSTAFFRSQLWDKIEIALGHLRYLGEIIEQLFGRFWDNFDTTFGQHCDYLVNIGGPYLGPVGSIFKKNQHEPWLAVPPIFRTPKLRWSAYQNPSPTIGKIGAGRQFLFRFNFSELPFPVIASYSFKGLGNIFDKTRKYPYGAYKKSFDPEYVMEMQLKVSFWVS